MLWQAHIGSKKVATTQVLYATSEGVPDFKCIFTNVCTPAEGLLNSLLQSVYKRRHSRTDKPILINVVLENLIKICHVIAMYNYTQRF
jgi:hypothetical protein